MSQSGVGEVYRVLHDEDGHVVLDGSQAPPDEEIPVDFCLPGFGLGGEGSCLMFIRDIMLACSKFMNG